MTGQVVVQHTDDGLFVQSPVNHVPATSIQRPWQHRHCIFLMIGFVWVKKTKRQEGRCWFKHSGFGASNSWQLVLTDGGLLRREWQMWSNEATLPWKALYRNFRQISLRGYTLSMISVLQMANILLWAHAVAGHCSTWWCPKTDKTDPWPVGEGCTW